MCKRCLVIWLLPVVALVLLAAGPGQGDPFDASLADPAWDGQTVPAGQQCQRFGGKPSTPAIKVSGIPAQTDAIVLAYSDLDYPPMDNQGHGVMGYTIPSGAIQVDIPPVPGHSFDLPRPFFLIAAHRAPGWDKAGAYMPPCSGGKGHRYTVAVMAVKLTSPNGKDYKVLAEKTLQLGRY